MDRRRYGRTDKPTDWPTDHDGLTGGLTDRLTNVMPYRQTDQPTDWPTDQYGLTDRLTDRLTSVMTYRQTDQPRDWPIDRPTNQLTNQTTSKQVNTIEPLIFLFIVYLFVFVIHLVSEWGDIIDEMSDRMANQPSLIRKFAKERYATTGVYVRYSAVIWLFSMRNKQLFRNLNHK